jgi:hypothetical protein
MALREAIDKGAMYGKQNGSVDDLNKDWKHGFLNLFDPSLYAAVMSWGSW